MATTVNLIPSSWTKTSSGGWSANNCSGSTIGFDGGGDYQGQGIFAKSVFSINASSYNSISFSWTDYEAGGITDLVFGVFNNSTPGDNTGTGIKTITSASGSTTVDISSLTGTKYVGFYFYSNGWKSDNYRYAQCNISSLTGELSANTITYKPGSYASGSTYTATKNNGSSITLRGATYSRTGYTQTGWSTSSSGSSKNYSLSASYSTNADLTLYPYWTANTYTITFNSNGGTSNGYSSTNVTYNNTYSSLSSSYLCSRTDYSFKGYYTASSGGTQILTSSGAFVKGTSYVNSSGQWIYAGNITLYAQYTKTTFTITPAVSITTIFEVIGSAVKVPAGDSVRISATTMDKYAFDYWLLPDGSILYWYNSASGNKTPSRSSDHKTGYLQIDSVTSADEGTYSAYAYRELTLNFTGNGCTVSPSTLTCRERDIVSITATHADNYIFEGWTLPNGTVLRIGDSYDNGRIYCEKTNGEINLKFTSISESDEGSYSANAKALSFITPIAGTGITNVSGGADPYTTGSTMTLNCTTKVGYNFYKWQLPDGTQLGKGETSGNVSVDSSGVLTITSVTASNAGYYTAIASKNFVNKKYHALIYNGGWHSARSIVIRKLLVPTNAIVDVNDVPILTSDGEFILVDESTEGLTPEYIYTDYRQYVPYFVSLLDTPDNIVYLGTGKPVYSGIGKYVYIQK